MRWTMAVFLLLAGCGAAEPGAPGDVAGPELREVSSPTDAPADVGTDPGSDPGPELPQDAAADILEELPDVAAETNLDLPGGDDGPRACDCPGPSVRVTLNNIPATMNGSEPYVANDLLEHAFHLALPTRGFLWQVVTDCPCGGCGDGLEAGLGEQGGYEEWFTDGQWDVDQDLPAGPAELCARVTDGCGNMSPWACLPTEIVVMTPALHPFQPPDPWLLVWRRDHRTITAGGEGEAPVLSEPGADGTWDVV
ncbi:MAG: hypothetical protein FJ098_07495, partial [Deltaproteobacteria bacterium]|nr:hypothetical protein [Deltaproteobacteria bacterium]